MKVELQCGDTITIPDGCKATIKDGSVVFEKEVQEFKNGDVLCSVYNSTIVIFKEMHEDNSNRFYTHYNTNHSSNEKWNKDAFRHATEEEKKELFDLMKENGLQWNAEEKRVENIRWRAKKGEEYFMIEANVKVKAYRDDNGWDDDLLYNALNYFHTQEQATEAAKRVKETLRKYHEEIGE
ncbi:hypothetical protein F0475_02480 [Prevotella sp. A2879]|uniref:Uncharacterized protein n=1 Tax=Prevotella vespertina TaxID=2608404 RepID=A0A7C9HD65_9BACT|nr:hypothetical protein [Prevotella vespertina]MUL27208.1 hypothetical protein [Prevotella vespertina]